MNPRSNIQSRHCVATKRNGHRCRAWALRAESLCKAHHPLWCWVQCWGGPLDGSVVVAFRAGPVFYTWPVEGERFPARIVDAGTRPFPWHSVSGAYVLRVVRAEGNTPVLSYDWFEAAALAPGVLTASLGGGGQ